MEEYKAVVLTEPLKLTIAKKQPTPLKPYQARLQVLYAGVCGTDIAIFNGDYKVPLPIVLGHEFVGIVTEVGDPEFEYLKGKRAVAEINNTCVAYNRPKLCPACERGLSNHCLERTVLGIIEADGTFAEQVVVPIKNIHPLPEGFAPVEIGVFIEPLAAAIQTFELTPIVRTNKVVVLGAGRLGLLIALVSARLGAETVLADLDEKKLTLAKNLIKDIQTLHIKDQEWLIRSIARQTNNLGADIVVEATGTTQGIQTALHLVRPRGTLAIKSTPGLPVEEFDSTRAVVNEIRIQGSRCGPFDKAIEFIQRYSPPLDSLIAEVFPLHRAAEAIQLAQSLPKVLIKP